jgi:hypothetical protein
MTTPNLPRIRRKHLDASVKHVEDALLIRAKVLDDRADIAPAHPELGIGPAEARLLHEVASEFRALAEELHYV